MKIMKQKITLTAILFLVILFAFGQTTVIKNNENFWKTKAERQFEELKQDDYKFKRDHQFLKNRIFPQNTSLKSSQAIKQRLDSLVSYYWDGTISQLVASMKIEFAYDTNWNCIHEISYNADYISGELIGDTKQEYTYDAEGNMVQYFYYIWDVTFSQWVSGSKIVYVYNANGSIIEEIEYHWTEGTNEWRTVYKAEYIYDDNENITQFIESHWDETLNQWLAYRKEEYTYNTEGYIAQFITYDWDVFNNLWVAKFKSVYSHNISGLMTERLRYHWDFSTSLWLVRNKDEYTYDANCRRTQRIEYLWYDANTQWVASYKYEYNYDANNMVDYITYEWYVQTNQWVSLNKFGLSYNDSFSFSDLILPYYIAEDDEIMPFTAMLTDLIFYGWNETMGDWMMLGNYAYYYSEQNVISILEINETELNVYPNPFSNYVSFDFSGNYDKIILEIFDVQGRKVISKEIENNEKVNMEGLNKGVYIYNLIIDGKVLNGKLFKK